MGPKRKRDNISDQPKKKQEIDNSNHTVQASNTSDNFKTLSLRFSHLTEGILSKLDDKDLVKCRMVNMVWKHGIENDKNIWKRKLQRDHSNTT